MRLERVSRSGPITSSLITTLAIPYKDNDDYAIELAAPFHFAIGVIRVTPEEKYGSTQRGFVSFVDLPEPKRRTVH